MIPSDNVIAYLDTKIIKRYYGTVELIFEDGKVSLIKEHRSLKEDTILNEIKNLV